MSTDSSTGSTGSTTGGSSATGRTARYVVGAVLMVGGIVCVVWGFSSFTGSALDGGGDGAGRAMALFAAGGLATVVGFGIVAFTRAAGLTGRGGYTRVTYEQGYGAAPAARSATPVGSAPAERTHCTACGATAQAGDRFCGACGAPLERVGQS